MDQKKLHILSLLAALTAATIFGMSFMFSKMALVTAALLFSLRRAVRCPQNTKTWWHPNRPVFSACVFLTLFAVSNKIYRGNTRI